MKALNGYLIVKRIEEAKTKKEFMEEQNGLILSTKQVGPKKDSLERFTVVQVLSSSDDRVLDGQRIFVYSHLLEEVTCVLDGVEVSFLIVPVASVVALI